MNTIIISILAFLLSIFPGCGMLQTPYQSMTFPGEAVVTDNIMTAIEAKDIAAIETMISQSSKQNMKDLPDNIDAIINSINGEIFEYDWSGTSDSDEVGFGKRVSRKSWKIIIQTAADSYRLDITWIVVNSLSPKEVGMQSMSLSDSQGNSLATTYVPKQ